MKNILDIFYKSKDYQKLNLLLDTKKNITVEETDNLSLKIIWAILLIEKYHKIFWFVKNHHQVQTIETCLENYFKDYEILSWDNQTEQGQLRFLYRFKKAKIILLPIDILSIQFPPVSEYQEEFIIDKNLKILSSEIIKILWRYGYERQDKAILEGDFSQRGDVLDFYNLGDNFPKRVEFFGNQITKIYDFNPANGEKINNLARACIKRVKATKFNQDIFQLITSKDLVFWDGGQELKEIISEMAEFNSKVLKYRQILYKLEKNKVIFWESLPGFSENKTILNIDYPNSKNYNGHLNKFAKENLDLVDYYKIIVDLDPSEKLKNIIDNPKMLFFKLALPNGLKAEKEKIIIFTEKELFGFKKIEKLKFGRREKDILKNIKPDDLIVHEDYGIGRFKKRQKLQKFTLSVHDYLVIEYSNKTYIYLPINLVSKITPYINFGKKIKLSKIGSLIWQKTKKNATESIYHLAKDILHIEALRKINKGFQHHYNKEWDRKLDETFEYESTPDQKNALREIYADLQKASPMDRLLCGDVGFGKTEIAQRVAAQVVAGGYQVTVLAPTTILVEQHYNTFKRRLKNFPIKIERISRFISKQAQKKIINDLKSGTTDIIIGTHRLLSSDIGYSNLGLVIIDEEQQFGVIHKEKLKRLRASCDILTMTATPIPRTLFLSLSGIRDISTIQTPPENRLSIKNYVHKYNKYIIKDFIKRELERQGQVYFVHNQVATIDKKAKEIQKITPNAKVAIAHGQMDEQQLSDCMADFSIGKYDILVASSIIKNGLDIPNVNTLIVDNADHFGLAELYQLRGRVGRGWRQAYTLYLLPQQISSSARSRMTAILENWELGSGYSLSLADLENRGGGNILGKDQSGYIAAIGLHLYTQFLSDTIKKMTHHQRPNPNPTS